MTRLFVAAALLAAAPALALSPAQPAAQPDAQGVGG